MLTVFPPQQYCCALLSVLLYHVFGSTRQEYNIRMVLIILINYCLYFMKCVPYQTYVDYNLTTVMRSVFLLCKSHFCDYFIYLKLYLSFT
jgi:hypothetical protein